jgi:hypothetical protein
MELLTMEPTTTTAPPLRRPRRFRRRRRLLRAAAAGFARDERGSVMATFIVFALPLALFLFVTYNTGIALNTRMRTQNVADAACYSASLWQARGLNYMAYSRRQILANYATMALCTSLDSALKMYDNIYDAQGLIMGGMGDQGLVTMLMEAPHAILDAEQCFSDSENQNPVLILRKGCDVMNRMLSNSQTAVYLSLANCTPIMVKVVQEADREAAADNTVGREFELVLPSFSSLALSAGGQYLEQEELDRDQVLYYCDNFTKGNFLGANVLPLLGRAPVGGMTGGDATYCGKSTPYIQAVTTFSSGVDISSSGDNMNSKESFVLGYYVLVVICVYGIPIPIGLPIFAESTESDYDVTNEFSETEVYKVRDGISNANLEPTSIAVVEATWNEHPYFMQNLGLGDMVSPITLSNGDRIQAWSRSKAYFRGPGENLPNTYKKPHLAYACWGAKLAALENYTVTSLVVAFQDAHY